MTITEVVLYQIKAESVTGYPEISKLADKFLQLRNGFISRTVKQDHKDETLFLDIVEWQTLADAESASQAFKNEPTLVPFFEVFDKVISFNHFHSFN